MYQKMPEDIKKEYYVNNYSNDGQRFLINILINYSIKIVCQRTCRHLTSCFKQIAIWPNDNPMGLIESLLAMKVYAPHHYLYAISAIVSEINKMAEGVPDPANVLKLLEDSDMIELVVEIAGNCLNMAFENASAEL